MDTSLALPIDMLTYFSIIKGLPKLRLGRETVKRFVKCLEYGPKVDADRTGRQRQQRFQVGVRESLRGYLIPGRIDLGSGSLGIFLVFFVVSQLKPP